MRTVVTGVTETYVTLKGKLIFMTLFLTFVAFTLATSFGLIYRKQRHFQGAVLAWSAALQHSVLGFLRTALSMTIVIGPLLLISSFVFSELIRFEGAPAFFIAVLSIGFAERVVGMITAPLIRTFWHQQGKTMPLSLDVGLYTATLTVLILEFLHSIPGVHVDSFFIALFYGFALFFTRYLSSLIRWSMSQRVQTNEKNAHPRG